MHGKLCYCLSATKICCITYFFLCTAKNKGSHLHHKPKTIFFTLKSYTYWKPIEEGTL